MSENISEFVSRQRSEFAANRAQLQARIRVAVGVIEPFATVNRQSELEKRDALAILSTSEYNLTTDDIFGA